MTIEFYGEHENPSAIVIRATDKVDGIEFFSPQDFAQQIGLMTRPSGYVVKAHIHNPVVRHTIGTQEVLVIRRGKILVKLFTNALSLESEITLNTGDVILLAHGGHEIEMIDETEILEIKQGPYGGLGDKTILSQELH